MIPSRDFFPRMRADVGGEGDLQEGGTKCVAVNQKAYALFKVAGQIYCLDNACTHMNGPLCRGRVSGFVVTCPLHGSRFDVRTGQVVGAPARIPVHSYPVAVQGGRIWAELP